MIFGGERVEQATWTSQIYQPGAFEIPDSTATGGLVGTVDHDFSFLDDDVFNVNKTDTYTHNVNQPLLMINQQNDQQSRLREQERIISDLQLLLAAKEVTIQSLTTRLSKYEVVDPVLKRVDSKELKSNDTLFEFESQTDHLKTIWGAPAPPSAVPTITNTLTQSLSAVSLSSLSKPPTEDPESLKTTFKGLVDKIIKTNDQPCSIFLQQRLRVETTETKGLIFDAVIGHLIPLMKNRFGNFLVQCLLDVSTEEQVLLICSKMKGYVTPLSCDRFGCHVMQKVSFINQAFEKIQLESATFDLVQELFPCVIETMTHRFGCHVWQRIFETEWSDNTVLDTVLESIRGNWTLIANDENGSLVVQCIFEHATDHGRIPIINELFNDTANIATGTISLPRSVG
jgi:hypothetical protein